MRLIDADGFKEKFSGDSVINQTMRLVVDEMPTAFDLEGAARKLQEKLREANTEEKAKACKEFLDILKEAASPGILSMEENGVPVEENDCER